MQSFYMAVSSPVSRPTELEQTSRVLQHVTGRPMQDTLLNFGQSATRRVCGGKREGKGRRGRRAMLMVIRNMKGKRGWLLWVGRVMVSVSGQPSVRA